MTSRMLGDAHSIQQEPPDGHPTDIASLHKSASVLGMVSPPNMATSGSVLGTLPPQTPILGLSVNGSMASTLPAASVAPAPAPFIPLHAFQQSVAPPPPPPHQQLPVMTAAAAPQVPHTQLPRQPSTHSFGAPSPQPSPATTRRAAPSATPQERGWASEDTQKRPLPPMGLPRSQGKLMPGRMSGGGGGGSQSQLQRQGSQGSVRREIPSTAVWNQLKYSYRLIFPCLL